MNSDGKKYKFMISEVDICARKARLRASVAKSFFAFYL
jgi:hypothetical protein